MVRCVLVAVLFLTGCATSQLEMKGAWEPKNALDWERARVEGAQLEYEDGSEHFVPPQFVENLISAHDRVAKASGMRWVALALVDTRSASSPAFDAFATREGTRPIIGVSLGLLQTIGDDPDALAAILGHEIAHVVLGHSPDRRMEREAKLQKSQAVGAGLTTGPAAVAALLFRLGAMAHYRTLTREEERAADEQGMKWTVKAGFDPCGLVRALIATHSLDAAGVPFFSTHPGGGERRELANRYSREANQRDCPETVAPKVVRTSEAREPAPTAQAGLSAAEKSYEAAAAAARADDFVTALRELRASAQAGHAPAQARLGTWYGHGYGGLERSEAEELRWTRLAADQGHAGAQAVLGAMYLRGRAGLKRDEREAVRLFRLSAERGHPWGETNLGIAHLTGQGGVERDLLDAARYLYRAALKGEPLAQANLAWIYTRGASGIPRDAEEAVRLYRLSADQKNATGQVGLAWMYRSGMGGLPKDEAEALRLTRLAAEQGHAGAQFDLAVMRENGQGGLPKDEEEARLWFRRAAEQGHRGAAERLERLGQR